MMELAKSWKVLSIMLHQKLQLQMIAPYFSDLSKDNKTVKVMPVVHPSLDKNLVDQLRGYDYNNSTVSLGHK